MRTTNRVSIIVSCVALALALICGPSATATAADRGQGVTADQLPGELRALTVQNQFIPGQGTPVGKVRRLRGHLVVRHGNSPEAYFAKQGDRLYTHDELFTLAKSRVRVRFTTADIVNMGANSRIRVDELVDDRQKRQKKTRMSMLRGKAMFYVMRLMKYNKVDTQVNTPTAVCGVRGTKFGIIVQKKTDLWSSMPLYLADASGTPLNYLLADNGGGTETIMVMVEGSGFMTAGGTTTGLGSGQTGSSGGGPPSTGPTPPGLGQGLNDETNPGDGDGDGDGDGEGGDDGGGDTGDSGTTGDAGEDASDTINQVTQQGLAPAGPTNRIGYFAAMLTNDTGGPLLDSLFISPEQADHEGPGIMGTSVNSASYTITFDGSPENDPVLTQVDTYYSGSPSDLGPQHQVISTQVGVNAFLAWGYWTMPTPFYSGTYVIDNPGVYVHGDPTPVENLGGITGHYVGSAWGTYWNSSGGAALAGTMSADVAIGSQKLQNLNVSVAGGGNTVSIIQQSDTYFSGPNGEFMLEQHYGNTSYVECLINGTAVEHGVVSGGMFGPNGEALGGTAAMRSGMYGNYEGAVVGFEGTKR